MTQLKRFTLALIVFMLLLPMSIAFADTIYVVQPNDSLSKIARLFGVTVQALIEANNIKDPNIIVVGSELIIPDGEAEANVAPTPVPAVPTIIVIPPGSGPYYHTVQPNESVAKIARIYGVTVQALLDANPSINTETLIVLVGQQVLIPVNNGNATAPTAPAPAPSTVTSAPAVLPYGSQPLYHTVQLKDSAAKIARIYGVTLQALIDANNIKNPSVVVVGQELLIPIPTATPASGTASAPAPSSPSVPSSPAPAAGANLFPNPSFEADWHFVNGIAELQLPNSWTASTDEGPNTLQPGDGGYFLRPECRVVPKSDIPAAEHDNFVFEGQKTIKCFKGGAPTNFAVFTDIYLQPGTYRMTIGFFADAVSGYDGSTKIWATDPLAAEFRIVHGTGGTNWTSTPAGQKGFPTYTFVVTKAGTVRLGAAFRNRFVNSNNGWFLDNWSLVKIK